MIDPTPCQRERDLEEAARLHRANERWRAAEPWLLGALASLIAYLIGVYL